MVLFPLNKYPAGKTGPEVTYVRRYKQGLLALGIKGYFPNNSSSHRPSWAKGNREMRIPHATKFWKTGQGLIESSLLLAFIAMASASLFLGANGGLKGEPRYAENPAQQSAGCR
jgi:hypothetical protein